MIEADIHIGVSTTNSNAYSPDDVSSIEANLEQQYNRNGKFFKIDGKSVEFRFNVSSFDVDKTSLDDKSMELKKSTLVETDSPMLDADGKQVTNTDGAVMRKSIKGVAIGLDNSLGDGVQGSTSVGNRIRVSPSAMDRRHTEAHELGHFLLGGSPNNPSTSSAHDSAGGVFFYIKKDPSGNIVAPSRNVNKNNIREIIKNTPIKK